MSTILLPLLEGVNDPVISAAARTGPILFREPPTLSHAANVQYYLLVDSVAPYPQLPTLIDWLDAGAQKIIVPLPLAKEVIGVLPSDRLIVLLDASSVSAVSDKIGSGVSGVFLKTAAVDLELISSIGRFFAGGETFVLPTTSQPPTTSLIRELRRRNVTLVVPSFQLTLSETSSSQLNLAEAFIAPLDSDRPDGLFPTVVSSATQGDRALGLVYSSKESITESILTGKGVYQSRKHGLWRKGETSGSTQELVRISVDCDHDSLQFSVIQHGSGFCHLGTTSCFGQLSGLGALEQTLKSRFESAPEGSYTKRLFNDPTLLRSKIMEEADELCQAQTKADVAFEAADLLYFALAKCISRGVGITDIEQSLDRKARKVTRRPGNAKPQWATPQQPNQLPTSAEIRMRTVNLDVTSETERAALLQRPVLKFDDMMQKVRPIVEDVRRRGDLALIELTAKFDKAQLTETVIRAPFDLSTMDISQEVRLAIDQAYANVRRFHKAQISDETLVVETMPGVVCSRFARPIARVGLYVPGGTAILPSTALMLGVPAQVAGCHEIVLATPPRPDGSISPEVAYVAHLVGASAILKAGGAQAIAALAYGTKTVPKVDKIFGPGNQWVTAAKMLVQNDTDALVSIDMPAGPSEVLVIADSTAKPAFVAADLLSQAEHGVDSQVVLVAVDLSPSLLAQIEEEVDLQAHALPRVDIVQESVRKSIIIQVRTVEAAFKFSNDYAPEHLILHLKNAKDKVQLVENAGSVFVGPYSPESCGDYASGTNHTLPTNGYARQFSGVNTLSFQKHITSQEVTKSGLDKLGPIVITLAECEGLEAHANAVRVRLNSK
ncbi:histidinol dehydrogenase-domain-containing protein [Hysterangium stoloniferum]|nr:histidinol dehydrogenase-domain-containing protein [Hysterangium stoloniferum]